jgi:hypothetical protein
MHPFAVSPFALLYREAKLQSLCKQVGNAREQLTSISTCQLKPKGTAGRKGSYIVHPRLSGAYLKKLARLSGFDT